MASLNRIVFGILILQIYVHAAPSDVSKLEEIAKVEQADPKLGSEPKEIESDSNSTESTETQRQKRWYNPYGYGFPPMNPLIYPGFNKRDEGANTGFYGGEDPLVQIHRRIQEIAHIVRQPPPPPPPHHFPIFYPVLFIPSGDCRCNENPTPGTDGPLTPGSDSSLPPGTENPLSDNNGTTPSIMNRWPPMDDERQNWGFLDNDTEDNDTNDGEDFSRPISFDPIRLNRPMRPPPPVEHGSVQSDSTDEQKQPQPEAPSSRPPPPSPQSQSKPQSQNRPQNSSPPQSSPRPGLAPPSPCDGAILSCCHQPQVAYDCFAIQGCPDFTSYGNPCDPNVILRVIERFQIFYGQKGG